MPETKPIDQVHVVCSSLVKPAKATMRHSMFMSGVDQMLRSARPMRTILFYKTDKESRKAVEALRCGLATALVAFYPLAGRVMQEGNRAVIDCNDEGVELLEAHCDIPFAELEHENFHIQPLFRQLAPMDTFERSDTLGALLASFQVTSFVGGLTVGIAISHGVADGISMWTFVRAVAEACRGEPITAIPLHARILLKPEVFTMGASFPDMPLRELSQGDPSAPAYNGIIASNVPAELLEQKIIHFSKEMLETLKRACMPSSDNNAAGAEVAGSVVSTYQALAAYLWKRLTMAQGLHEETSLLQVPLDVRMRMVPPLTPAYFGNAVVVMPTLLTAGELTSESLGDTAARIRHSIQQGDDVYIKKAMKARERCGPLIFSSMIRNASRFPVYESGNFGWGEPEAVRPPWSWNEGLFTWYPGKKPKSIDVIASLTSTTCANFFSTHLYPNDPLYLSAFPYSHVP